MRPARIALLTVTILAALYGVGLSAQENWAGPGCCGLTWPTPNPTQADRLAAAEDPKGANPAVQRRALLTELQARPADAGAWLRLAYADNLSHGGTLGAEGIHALEMSYLALPYADPQMAAWRLGLALNNWSRLTQPTIEDAIVEMRLGDPYRKAVIEALPRVRDPKGRMAGLRAAIL